MTEELFNSIFLKAQWMIKVSCCPPSRNHLFLKYIHVGLGFFFHFMAAVTIYSDFRAQENKVSHCFHCFPFYLPWSDATNAMILVFWMLSFNPKFSLSSFTFIKRLFSSCLISALRVVQSAYLRLLICLPAILIPAVLHPSWHFAWCTLHIG